VNGRTGLLGVVGCIAALMLALVSPGAALAGWLMGFVFWSAIPIGALALLMMMRLVPGGWRDELSSPAQTALLLLPLAAVAALPVLAGIHALYGWADDPPKGGFRSFYLVPWFFALRTAMMFAGTIILAVLLVLRPAWSVPLSAAGLVAFVLLDTTIVVDWLMSLDVGFHSSGFGLYVMSIQMTIAIAALIFARLAASDAGAHTRILGGLLLTTLLIWAYFAFMQYFIIWSGDLPQGVRWYQRRADGPWSAVEYAIGALQLTPAFLLFFPPVREHRRWLLALTLAVLAGKVLEMAWLVLPTVAVGGATALASAVLCLLGLGLLTLTGFRQGRQLRGRRQRTA
jgi:hypothetical protein